jgi:hypothetical protein
MAVPTKYNPKRLSDYTLRGGTFGSRQPSFRMSGPGHGANPYKGANKKMLASFEKAQQKHEGLMAGIAKAESDTFKRLNDALTASREADAKIKDKLGNTMPPSDQTNYLGSQLAAHLVNRSQKGQRIKPGGPGTDPSQYTDGVLNTPVPQPGQAAPTLPPVGADPTATEPGGGPAGPRPETFPIDTVVFHKTGAKLTMTGQTRSGPNGQEFLVKNDKGEEAWVPRDSFRTEDEQRGGGMENLLQHFAPKWKGPDPDAFNPGA